MSFSTTHLSGFMSGGGVSSTLTTIFLTSGTSWAVPGDWNSSTNGPGGYANKIECIGAGGGGGARRQNSGVSANGSGGGGGGHASVGTGTTTAGSGGNYGAGGVGVGVSNTTGTATAGSGIQGLIIIRYYALT